MISKPGKDPKNPLLYLPISLLNITGKISEKIRFHLSCQPEGVHSRGLSGHQEGLRQSLARRTHPKIHKHPYQSKLHSTQGSIFSLLFYIVYCRDFPVADKDQTQPRGQATKTRWPLGTRKLQPRLTNQPRTRTSATSESPSPKIAPSPRTSTKS
jgi:hypothetical protein